MVARWIGLARAPDFGLLLVPLKQPDSHSSRTRYRGHAIGAGYRHPGVRVTMSIQDRKRQKAAPLAGVSGYPLHHR